jgi:D-3-phosphoglycerate dehydrogenase
MKKILVVEHFHPAGEALIAAKAQLVFPEPQNAAGILAEIGECDALLVRNTRITRALIEAGPRLMVIGRHGVGYDTVDIEAASELGIPVVYTPAANTESVTEIAMGFIILMGRRIMRANAALRSGELFSDSVTLSVMAERHGLANYDLWGKTLGVVGVGRIGSRVSKNMVAAFHMRVLGYDPYVDAATLAEYGVEKVERLEELLPQCDFVTLHCPGGAATRHMIDGRMLALMKPSAYLINTARGTIVDQAALIAALQSKQIAGAAMDVYDPEPPHADNALLHMDNVMATPHFCAMTEESMYNMGTTVAQGILDVLEGKRPQAMVNPEVWEHRRKF